MYATIVFYVDKKSFELETNISYKEVNEFIINWIKTDIGKKEDQRELKRKPEYYISIYKDENGYQIEDNCENRNLRLGILGLFVSEYKYIRKEMEK